MPKISILCASYNHEKYVEGFIRSVLAQTEPDWELIIVDDCSADGNVAVIEKFHDSRIRLVRHAWNRGINQGFLDAFRLSKAPIIQLFDSDDLMFPDNVETLANVFSDPTVEIACAPLLYMDADGHDLEMSRPLPVGMSRIELLAELALSTDCLPSPGMAMRRECYAELLPLDVSFMQFQDWQINLQLVARHDVRMLDRPLVRYRRGHSEMVSAPSPAVVLRTEVEMPRLMDTACRLFSRDVESFNRCFGDRLPEGARADGPADVPFLLARLAVMSPDRGRRRWGFQKILECLSSETDAQTIHERYGFGYSDYMKLTVQLSDERKPNRSDDACACLRSRLKRYRRRFQIALMGLVALGVIALLQAARRLLAS